MRPFGTALLVAGVDEHGEHLFETDPSGALVSYKAGSIGAGRNVVMEVFEEEYQEGMAMEDAVVLGLKALKKATEEEKLNPKAVEIGIVQPRRELPSLGRLGGGDLHRKGQRRLSRGPSMVDIEDAIVARLESHGETFEILIDPKVVKSLKEGKEVNLYRLHGHRRDLQERPQGNARTGGEAEGGLRHHRPDGGREDDHPQGRGAAHRPAAQGDAGEQEERASSPRSPATPSTPRPEGRTPVQRIEMAMEEAKVHIDPFKSVEVQIKDVLDKLRPIIPIRFDKMRIAVKLTGEEYGRCYEDIVHFGKIQKEEWQPNGSWIGVVEIPAGMRDDFYASSTKRRKATWRPSSSRVERNELV